MTFELTEIHIHESDRFRVHVFPGRVDDNEVLCVLCERPVQDGFSANGSPQQDFESQGIVNALDEIIFIVTSPRRTQKYNFSPNCMIRAFCAERIWPNVVASRRMSGGLEFA